MKARIATSGLLALLCVCPVFGQGRGKAEASVNGKSISIDYGRPSLKGRDILSLAPVGTIWRVGMNQATEITSSGELKVGDKELKAGKYSLWVKKEGADSWTLLFHPKTGIWGAPALTEGFVAETPLKMEKASDSAEQLTISLKGEGDDAQIRIQWGTAALEGKFEVK